MTDRRRPDRRLLIPILAGLWATLACVPGCDPLPPEGKEVGKLAPDIVGEDVDGKPLRLSDFRGKVVLVNFWATWCPPCRAMIPHERDMVERKYRDRPFVLLGIAPESSETLKDFFKTNPMPWPNIVDENKLVSRQWGATQLPTTILIDDRGVIRERWIGGAAISDIWTAVAKAVNAAESR